MRPQGIPKLPEACSGEIQARPCWLTPERRRILLNRLTSLLKAPRLGLRLLCGQLRLGQRLILVLDQFLHGLQS